MLMQRADPVMYHATATANQGASCVRH
jgi:hypothetical protein